MIGRKRAVQVNEKQAINLLHRQEGNSDEPLIVKNNKKGLMCKQRELI